MPLKKRVLPFVFTLCVFIQLVCVQNAGAQEEDALAAYRGGNYAAAIDICKREIAGNPLSTESYIVLCWSLLRMGRYNEALGFSQKLSEIARYDVRVIEILGEVNYYQGKNSDALKYFQDYANLAPEGQRIEIVYYFMGEIYIRLAQYRHADIALSTALHYAPSNARWWMRLAYAREMAGEKDEALAAYKRALDLDANLIDAARGVERLE